MDQSRPSIISCKTIIGFGAPSKEGTAATHGAPLGADEIAAARENLGWPLAEFVIPDTIKEAWNAREKGFSAESAWKEKLVAYEEEHPDLAMELVRRIKGQLPGHFPDISGYFPRHVPEMSQTFPGTVPGMSPKWLVL